MATPTLTFPCPFCGRRMGVGLELLGKHVRCPHCKQVVLAPSSPGTAPPKAAPTPATPPTPRTPAPAYTFPQKETAESILSDPNESEDEVFGSHSSAKKVPAPQLPNAPPDPPTEVSPSSPPRERPPLEQTAALPNPYAGTDPTPAPLPPPTKPSPASAPAATANPWAGLDEMVATSVPVEPPPTPAAKPANPQPLPEPEPDRTRHAPHTSGSRTLLVVVTVYALVMTGLTVYGWFFKTAEKLPPDHPLSTIPDTFGEFDPASRKKVTQYKFPIDGELPPQLKTRLGGKLEVGQLAIEPTKVEVRPLKIVTETKTGRREAVLPRAVVMQLRVTNTSPDVAIFPMDPAFTRQASRDDRRPATRLLVGTKPFFGGAIEWPLSANITRKFEQQQADDATPLKPGETRDYVVFSEADPAIVAAVQEASEPMLWRVQVRRGFIDIRGQEVPVTAIIGVEFFRGQVHNLQ